MAWGKKFSPCERFWGFFCGFLGTEVERNPAQYMIVFARVSTSKSTMMQPNCFFFVCLIHICGYAVAAQPPPKPQSLSLVDVSGVHTKPPSSNASSLT